MILFIHELKLSKQKGISAPGNTHHVGCCIAERITLTRKNLKQTLEASSQISEITVAGSHLKIDSGK